MEDLLGTRLELCVGTPGIADEAPILHEHLADK